MRSTDESGVTGLQQEPGSGNETLETEYLHMSGPQTGHVGPGNTLTDLQNESVIFSSEDDISTKKTIVKPIDQERKPDFSRNRDVKDILKMKTMFGFFKKNIQGV